MRLVAICGSALLCLLLVSGIVNPLSCSAADKPSETSDWISLFDGKSTQGWTQTQFGGPGEITVEDGCLIIEMGAPLNGVTISKEAFKPLPKINYEISLEAQRSLGGDFFVGLTIPVNETSCSLIMGGWGGGVIGISSLDGFDASENETTTYATFKNEQWYQVRMKVTDKVIQVWLDQEQIIDVEITDRKIDTRIEVDISKPLGLATFETTAKIRNFKMRPLPTQAEN